MGFGSQHVERIVGVLTRLDISYLVTGSVRAMAYGEPRLTNDIHIVAAIEQPHVPALVAAFPEPEFYISAEMIVDAIRHRTQFNIIHPASGLKVDVIVRKETAFDRSRFSRVRRIKPAENEVDTAYIADWSRRLGLTDIWDRPLFASARCTRLTAYSYSGLTLDQSAEPVNPEF